MLALTRNPGERIRIGEDIIVTFVGYRRGGGARIAIQAPPDVRVDREEIYFKRKEEGHETDVEKG